MAYKEIEQWAMILKESEDADKAYERACDDAAKEAEDAVNAELGYEDEVIDPSSVGFLDSEPGDTGELDSDFSESDSEKYDEMAEWFNANGYPLEDDDDRLEQFAPQGTQMLFKVGCSPTGYDEVVNFDDALHCYEQLKEADLAECGFSEDGRELQEKEVEDDLSEDLHGPGEQATIELEVSGPTSDGYGTFEDAVRNEFSGVSIQKLGPASGGSLKYQIQGSFEDLQKVFAFYLGLNDWDEVVANGDDSWFDELVIFQDGDTLDEADYRDAIAHVFDPIGVKASTANLKANNACEMSIVKEAVKAEIQKRKLKKALLERDFNSLSDEDLAKLDSVLAAKDQVDANTANRNDEKLFLAFLKTMGIDSIEEYKAMDPNEFNRRFKATNKPLDAANGFARSYKTFRAYHRPDRESGGATSTDFVFNPSYAQRLTKTDMKRRERNEEKQNREQNINDLLAGEEQNLTFGDMSLPDFGKFLHSIDKKKAKELEKAMIEVAHEDHKDDPEAEAQEVLFIKKIFGKMPTFRDIARAWYPGVDPNKTQQSVNRFTQDTQGNFLVATRRATGTTDGSLDNFYKNVLGNEANFHKFLAIMKDMSKKRAARKNSLVNRGNPQDDATAEED